MVATRNAWAESMTWEKTMGRMRFSIWRNFAAIGSDRLNPGEMPAYPVG